MPHMILVTAMCMNGQKHSAFHHCHFKIYERMLSASVFLLPLLLALTHPSFAEYPGSLFKLLSAFIFINFCLFLLDYYLSPLVTLPLVVFTSSARLLSALCLSCFTFPLLHPSLFCFSF